MPSTSLRVDQYLVAAAVVLTCVLFTSQAADPVNVIKLTALLLVAIGLMTTFVYRAVRHRVVQLPWGVAGVMGGLLLLAFSLSAMMAPVTSRAIVGAYGRNSGLLAYAAALLLFLAGLRVFGRPQTRVLLGGIVLAGLFTAVYGLLQKMGIDAIAWNNPFNPIIAALGNPNFASGYLGIAGAVAAGGALYEGWHRGWRLTSTVTAVLCLAAAALSASVQGPIAAGAGLLVVVSVFALDLTSRPRTGVLFALWTTAALALAALVAGAFAKAGPAARIFNDIGSEARVHYWAAAMGMFRDEPTFGVGLDHYGSFWRSTRSAASAEALGGGDYSDAAHSVPLQMLAQGGFVLGVTYAAFVGVVFLALVRGLVRLRGHERMLLGTVGGGWAAYQVQSLVSIDQVPLLTLHFALAAAVVATAGVGGWREFSLPGAAQRQPSQISRRKKPRSTVPLTPTARTATGRDFALLCALALVALTLSWVATVPLRANMSALDGDRLRSIGDGTGAYVAYDRATSLLPSEATYWIKKVNLFQNATPPQTAQAREAIDETLSRDPYELNALRTAASLAEQEGDLETARTLLEQALKLDPMNPETVTAAATFELRHRGAARAREILLERSADLDWAPTLWTALGDAHAVLDEPLLARRAYQRALELDPSSEHAKAGLAELDTA